MQSTPNQAKWSSLLIRPLRSPVPSSVRIGDEPQLLKRFWVRSKPWVSSDSTASATWVVCTA